MSRKNSLLLIPHRKEDLAWRTERDGSVTLLVQNRGLINSLAQRLLHKPKCTQVHLDQTGSFLWQLIDGKANVFQLGEAIKAQFGAEAEPLYERLEQFLSVLESYGYVKRAEQISVTAEQ